MRMHWIARLCILVAATAGLVRHLVRFGDCPLVDAVGDEKRQQNVWRLLGRASDRVRNADLELAGERTLLQRRQRVPDLSTHVRQIAETFTHLGLLLGVDANVVVCLL